MAKQRWNIIGLMKQVALSLVFAAALPTLAGNNITVKAEPAMIHKVSGLGPRCRLLKIDSVFFKDGGKRGWYLYVGGFRRFSNMDVGIEHRGYRGGLLTVDVVGCTPNFIAFPLPTPFNLELPLRDIPKARQIRIVGANGTVTRRLPGR